VVNATEYDVFQSSGSIKFEFTPTLRFDYLQATLSGGLETESFGPFTVLVPDTGQCYDPWCSGNLYEPFVLDRDDITQLTVHLEVPPAQDADLFLLYDTNDNGVADGGDTLKGSSGNAAGVDEEIVVMHPAAGRYFTVIDGYDVDPDSGVEMDWWYATTFAGGIPSEDVTDFQGPISVGQDDPDDWTTASYTRTITVDQRFGALYATVTDIPAGSDVDLIVTDSSGAVVTWSANGGNADEEVAIYPEMGAYRLVPGETYTFWVHGYNVPTPPVTPTLTIWHDELNLWLETSDSDVHVMNSVAPNETVSLRLHYDKTGWAPGDPPLSARLVAGPDGLPQAFDELILINRTEAPGEPVWNPENLVIDLTAYTPRGPTAKWAIGGVPISTARIAP
ncbi:MAG: hypothetical protein H5T70_06205, partial [Chloroflexi bacterium]|nr:hypothetical protein [Chloroflexota bacterium]